MKRKAKKKTSAQKLEAARAKRGKIRRLSDDPEMAAEAKKLIIGEKISLEEACEKYNISPTTFYGIKHGLIKLNFDKEGKLMRKPRTSSKKAKKAAKRAKRKIKTRDRAAKAKKAVKKTTAAKAEAAPKAKAPVRQIAVAKAAPKAAATKADTAVKVGQVFMRNDARRPGTVKVIEVKGDKAIVESKGRKVPVTVATLCNRTKKGFTPVAA
jgi:sRNA-binding protein